MIITYLGHAAFKLRGKDAVVVTDPYSKSVGFSLNKLKAEVVTVSHEHDDHNAIDRVEGSSKRPEPYIIRAPGEYEVNGVGIFGWGSYHDDQRGALRGKNVIFNILIDGVRVCHLGDLGHTLDDGLVADIGAVDVLLVPVGGVYTINYQQAVEIVNNLQPSWVIPMHFRTDTHNPDVFKDLDTAEPFLKEMGVEQSEEQSAFVLTELDMPEETTVVRLSV
jgi:L-ascorbate metabolism protein UlaG (beta-lactamase superfamily)